MTTSPPDNHITCELSVYPGLAASNLPARLGSAREGCLLALVAVGEGALGSHVIWI